MRLATWNVNSVKARLPRLLDWLETCRPDVACLQELKCLEGEFPYDEVSLLGYDAAVHSHGRWNGVAVLSRVGLTDVCRGFEGCPGFPEQEARAVGATCGGVRVWSVYVPNGRTPDDPHYAYKLAWLAALRDSIAGEVAASPFVIAGDFNVAPDDVDVWDRAAFDGATHVTAPERQALAELHALGLHDLLRARWPDERAFTYWDYRAGMFSKDLGMRIDLALGTGDVRDRLRAAWVDRAARKGKGPSDHAPLVIDLDEAPDGDIGPLVPPPSARAGR